MSLFIKVSGHGEPLVLLHGWAFNHAIWDELAHTLANRYTVYQVDLPAHGKSSVVSYQLPILLEHLQKALPQPAIWMGWSLGGLLAMAMARRYPQHVKALALVATSPCFMTQNDWQSAMPPKVLQNFAAQLQNDSAGTLKRFLALQVLGSESAKQTLKYLIQALDNAGYAHPEGLRQGLQLLIDTDLRAELAMIRCPAWLCLGELDALVPHAIQQTIRPYWQDLQIDLIKSAAHIPFISHPEIFKNHLTAFLNTLSQG